MQVTGTVSEFRPASDLGSAAVTELIDPILQLVATERTLPQAIPITGVADLEVLEGMRVSVRPYA